MSGLWEILFGPQAGVECRRALTRRWVSVLRWGMTIPAAGVLLLAGWIVWFLPNVDATFLPAQTLRTSLVALTWASLTIAALLSPAMVAGTLGGEKARGTLGVLIVSEVSSREIVASRLIGRLAAVGVLILALVPAIVFLAGLMGFGVAPTAVLVFLPFAVAAGSGALALVTSVFSRRGRDALLAVYLFEVLLVVLSTAARGANASLFERLVARLDPYATSAATIAAGSAAPAIWTVLFWSAAGIASVALAAWRLFPSFLKQSGGTSVRSRRARRRRVPEIGDDVMRWKEIHIERLAPHGRLVRVAGAILIAYLVGGSLLLGSAVAWYRMVGPLTYQYWGDPARINAWLQNAQNADLLATGALQGLYGSTWNSFPVIAVGWIIQWALGLRAAATVAGERERGTWDGLLVSMLEGREIIRAKILGSLTSLRGLLASAVTCWTVALACGAMGIADYLIAVSTMFVVGTFMVAAGVYNSLSASAAGRATTRTLVVWIASFAADGALWVVAAFATMALAAVAGIFRLLLGVQLTPAGPMGMFSYVVVVFSIVRLGAYALATFLVAAYCRRHFAKLAGRTREFVAVDARGRSIRTPAPVVAEIVDAT